MAVLKDPSSAPGSPMLVNNAESPIATRLLTALFDLKASVPMAILLKPVVLAWPARSPQLTLPVGACNSPTWILFTLNRKGWLSIFPINWVEGLIPLLPPRPQETPGAITCHEVAEAVPVLIIT